MNWERSEHYEEWGGCLGCAHYLRGRCVAYPNSIPLPIVSGEVDHMVPRPGQVGETVYEPMDIEVWRETGERVPAEVPAGGG